jgi:hypothetical protein
MSDTNKLPTAPSATVQPPSTRTVVALNIIGSPFWQAFAVLVWVFVITKLFVFDIDNYLVGTFLPHYDGVLAYKFFFIVGLIAVAMLFLRGQMALLLLHLTFYPVIVLIWKVPRFVLRQESWVLAFAVMHAAILFCRSFTINFVLAAFGLVAAATAVSTSSSTLLWGASVVLLGVTIIMYVRRFISVFKSSFAPEAYRRIFAGARGFVLANYSLDEKLQALPVLTATPDQLQTMHRADIDKWRGYLEVPVLFNRTALFFAKKLRAYQQSGFPVIANALTLTSLVVATIASFSFINFALFQIDSTYFETPRAPSFFTFIWYSFNALVFNSVKELAPNVPVSQAVWMIEGMLAFFLVVILASLFLSHRGQREAAELNAVIANIEDEGRHMEGFIQRNWHIDSVDQAIVELTRLQASMLKVMLFFSDRLK